MKEDEMVEIKTGLRLRYVAKAAHPLDDKDARLISFLRSCFLITDYGSFEKTAGENFCLLIKAV